MDPIGAAFTLFDALSSVLPQLVGPISMLTCVSVGYILVGNILSGMPLLYFDAIKFLKGLQFMLAYGLIMFTMGALYGSLMWAM